MSSLMPKTCFMWKDVRFPHIHKFVEREVLGLDEPEDPG